MSDEEKRQLLLEKQYKLAIDARDKLNDNYYKWMSYYYLANAGVVVAITTLFSKQNKDHGILVLGLIGVFVCILWHLSCKGYYYWSKNWIYIIIRLERMVITDNTDLGVYSIFSDEVAEKEDSFYKANKAANISTPKLTLLFSFFCILFWLCYSIHEFYFNQFNELQHYTKCAIIVLFTSGIIYAYLKILPDKVKSRYTETHTLIKCLIDKND